MALVHLSIIAGNIIVQLPPFERASMSQNMALVSGKNTLPTIR